MTGEKMTAVITSGLVHKEENTARFLKLLNLDVLPIILVREFVIPCLALLVVVEL